MYSSQNADIIFEIYNDKRTVFTLSDIAMLIGEDNFNSLNQKLNYYVKTGKLLRPRKGIYAKFGYNSLELACLLYTPCYISLEYVLQKTGIIFQYGSKITAVSYLSRSIEIADNTILQYRKIKNNTLITTQGIQQTNNINIATKERAFLDILYLDRNYYFDNLHSLNKESIIELLPIYQSKILEKRTKKILQL